MKGKKILVLASIFAGAALVGSTFAAWAVTDNADPFGVKVSPGSIATDTVNFVTLSYGDRTYADVEGLAVGQNRLAATVGLKADTSNSQSYTGKFQVTLIDQTPTKGTGIQYLIDYLTVKVYDSTIAADANGVVTTDVSKLTPIGTYDADHLTSDIAVTVSDNTVKNVYVTVSLASTVTASILENIKTDIVYIQMNWNSNGTDEVSASKVYLKYSAAGKSAYCYAWTSAKTNHEYPGAAMTDEGNGLYSLDLSLDYEHLLFVVKQGDNEIYKSVDLDITSAGRTQAPCYSTATSAWGAVPANLEAGLYLVGTINSWTPSASTKLTVDPSNSTHYSIANVQLSAGDKIKVRNADGDVWYTSNDPWTDCGFTNDDDGNIVISAAGVYTINVNTAATNENYIYLTK